MPCSIRDIGRVEVVDGALWQENECHFLSVYIYTMFSLCNFARDDIIG